MVVYAEASDFGATSKRLFDSKGSNTCDGATSGMVNRSVWVRVVIAAASALLPTIVLLCCDFARVLVSRLLRLNSCRLLMMNSTDCYVCFND